MYVDILEIEKEHLKLVQISFWKRVIDMETCGFGPSNSTSFPGERGHEIGSSISTCKK